MNKSAQLCRLAHILGAALALFVRDARAQARNREPVEIVKTNWTTRSLTNVVELWMPTNEFVTEYHTNWMKKPMTNLVEVFKTKWVPVTLTNVQTVEQTATNWKTLTLTNWETTLQFKTNFVTQSVTNVVEVEATTNQFVTAYKTNWVALILTNTQPVELVRTNWTTAYQTNLRTLTLTNWETAVQFKTNWVKQNVTTTVEIDAPTKAATAPAVAEPAPVSTTVAQIEPTPVTSASPAVSTGDVLALEAGRTSPVAGRSGQAEVLLRVSLEGDPTAALQVQEWRVERVDGSVALFVRDRDFKRPLPAGKYRVEVKARRDGDSPLLTARRTLDVTPEDVVFLAAFVGRAN